jgi:hypothetical protein
MTGSDPAVEAGVAAGQQASALGRSQMQAASAVGIGVDSGQAGLYVPYPIPNGTGGLIANRGYVVRFVAPRSMPISKIAFYVATAATADDPCDVGIYSGAAARLGSSGSQSGLLNSLGLKTVTLLALVNLIAGQTYYAAFACGPVGGTVVALTVTVISPNLGNAFGALAPNIEQSFNNAAFPLPATFATTGAITSCPALALIQ